MTEFLTSYKEEILRFLVSIQRGFSIFLIALAFVYLMGRMLNLAKSPTVKNMLALFVIVGGHILYSYAFPRSDNSQIFITLWDALVQTSISIILYVLIGFKLYDRVDSLLDKKIGEDKELPPPKLKNKKAGKRK